MRPLIAGKWKMHGLTAQLSEIEAIAARVHARPPAADVLICVPATLLSRAAQTAAGRIAIGTRWKLPVEVLAFGWQSQARFLESIGATVNPREGDGGLYRTDEGNIILDCGFGPIADPAGLSDRLQARAGLVGHGLFIGIASDVIVAGEAGTRHLQRGRRQ
jgi:hypothetical protein